MICYHDKTFCDSDCVNSKCFHFLSSEDEENAQRLGLPIAFSDFSKDCQQYISEENENV